MPNGVDPVWMETVRIAINRDRLRSHKGQRKGHGSANDGGGDHGSRNEALPSDFSIIVWNRLQGRGQAQPEKVEDFESMEACFLVGLFQLCLTDAASCHIYPDDLLYLTNFLHANLPLGYSHVHP